MKAPGAFGGFPLGDCVIGDRAPSFVCFDTRCNYILQQWTARGEGDGFLSTAEASLHASDGRIRDTATLFYILFYRTRIIESMDLRVITVARLDYCCSENTNRRAGSLSFGP